MSAPTISYKNHRFPPQIIAHAVWLYFRFPLSLRLVEEMLLERGIVVSYETIRRWGRKFGAAYVKRLRRKTPSRKDIWHLDEMVVTIGGRNHWLWRAVDQDGYVLDEIVQARRDTKAAKRLLIRLLKKQGLAPKRIVTDKLRSYAAAKRDVMPAVEHRSHKGLNNRAENSHLPLRKRERLMQGFQSVGGLQRFISVFSAVRSKPPPSAVFIGWCLWCYRVSLWTHTKTAPAYRFYQSLTLVAVAVGRRMRRFGSLKKVTARE